MADAMASLVLSPELAARFGACGRRRIQESFTIAHHLNQIAGLIDQVIAANR